MLEPPAAKLTAKAEEIRRVLSEPTVDLWKLRELALTEGGLVNDSLRKLAWPKLVGADHHGFSDNNAIKSSSSSTSLLSHESSNAVPDSLDHEQIERDVSRVTWHLLTGNQRSRNFQMKNKHRKRIAQLLKKKQKRLGDYLNLLLVLSYHEEGGDDASSYNNYAENSNNFGTGDKWSDEARLQYYQGFHDVASIVLSALGGASLPVALPQAMIMPNSGAVTTTTEEGALTDLQATHTAASSMGLTLACQVLLKLSHSHLRDAMRANFLQLQSALKLILMPLLAAFDAETHSHLYDCEMEPYFCLSWVITWFSHDIRDTSLVKRLFDFFIVSHPLMSVYMSVAMIIHPLNRIEVLEADCDFACVHNALADLPKNSSNVGWKYLPGEVSTGSSGYATGDDDDASYDASLQDQSLDEGDDGSLMSGMGGGQSRSRGRVPFQELIDLSISLMHKIPPRNLINLAQSYHTEITLQPLMALSSTIALLQPPPTWSLISSADSDWVLRQKMREEHGSTKLNRHQRKNRLKQQPIESSTHPLLLEKPSIQAIIATGTGPDGRSEARKLRKKQRFMFRCVVVVVLSMLVALAKNHYSRRPLSSSSRSHSKQQLKDVLLEDNVAQLLLTEDVSSIDAAVDTNDISLVTKKDKQVLSDEVTISLQGETEMIQDQRMEGSGKNRETTKGSVERENRALTKEQAKGENPTVTEEHTDVINVSPPVKKKPKNVCADDEHIFSSYVREREATLQALPRSSDQMMEESCKNCEMANSDSLELENSALRKEQAKGEIPTMTEEVANVENAPPPVKEKVKDVCADDEASCVVEQHISSSYAREREATLQALLRSSLLFVKNLKHLTNNQTLDLPLDQLEEHLDFIMAQLMDTAKETWFKISPVLLNALHIGWRQIRAGWTAIAPAVEKELSMELEGGSLEWAEDAMKNWKKQEVLLRNQGKLIRSIVSDASGKLSKAGKKKINLGKN